MKAIFFDIDGTLVSKENPTLKLTLIAAFEKLRKQGVLLFIATGRHFLEIESLGITRDFKFDGYVTLNGAYCYVGDTVIHKDCISKEDAKILHQYLEKNNIASLYVEETEIYCNRVDKNLRLAQIEIHSPIPKVKTIVNIDDLDIYLFCPYTKDSVVNEMVNLTNNCSYTSWFTLGYDVVSKSSRKDIGIKKILEHFQIDKKDTMAFGDSANDSEMLQMIGLGIAMGNSSEAIKALSDYVTTSVDDDGVLRALDKFALL